MTDSHEFLENVTYHADDMSTIPYDKLRVTLREKSIARVTGLFNRDAIRDAFRHIADNFDPGADRKHDPRDTDAVRRNFQKLQIGANSGIGTRRTLGRFVRILYNPVFQDDIYTMRQHFMTLARFRNHLYGFPESFAVEGTDEGLFTCARIHQYPRGGGFMVPHSDMFSRVVTEASDMGYFQVFLILTEQGVDYEEGGGYIDLDEQRFLFESHTRAGDVVIYDGRTVHGVADIDPMAPLELDRFSGRAAAFVSLYKHLEPGASGYGRLSEAAEKRYGTPS